MKLSNKKTTVTLSAKRGINLINHEDEKKKAFTILITILLIALVALIIAKFGVIDQLAKVTVAEDNYNLVHQNYEQMKTTLERYSDVQSEYRKYSTEWLDNNEDGKYVSVNRLDVLDLIEKELMGNGTINSIKIEGEIAEVEMSGLDLEDISKLCISLEKNDIVAYATLTEVETEEKEEIEVEEVVVSTDEENEEEETTVVMPIIVEEDSPLEFNIKITLQSPSESEEGASAGGSES